jgi:hypothetical protein
MHAMQENKCGQCNPNYEILRILLFGLPNSIKMTFLSSVADDFRLLSPIDVFTRAQIADMLTSDFPRSLADHFNELWHCTILELMTLRRKWSYPARNVIHASGNINKFIFRYNLNFHIAVYSGEIFLF